MHAAAAKEGAWAIRRLSVTRTPSFRYGLLRSTTEIDLCRRPARAVTKEVLPEPGGPWNRCPRRQGIPCAAALQTGLVTDSNGST